MQRHAGLSYTDTSMNKILTLLLAAALWQVASAAPARPGVHVRILPDGTEVRVRMAGDEHTRMTLSEEGWPLVEKGGYLYYADVDADGRTVATDLRLDRAGEPEVNALKGGRVGSALVRRAMGLNMQATRGEYDWEVPEIKHVGLTPGGVFPAYGKPKGLVILVEFADTPFRLEDPLDYFTRMVTEKGFSDNRATGSVRDWFADNSNGQFVPEFDVVGPVCLSEGYAYYGKNNAQGFDANAYKMIVEACQLMDPVLDFNDYDNDGDGLIDNVFVYYAGRGEASGGGADTIWPHQWEVGFATHKRYWFDGVELQHYTCSNEWEYTGPDGIGTFVHEFSHTMGIPDLYTTDGSDAFTPGVWSVMDVGCYNNDSKTPANYSTFERWALGWLEPFVLEPGMEVELAPITGNVTAMVRGSGENEYFFFENRYREGWDKQLPRSGMLVWHVDYHPHKWYLGEVNNDPDHQHVDLMEADGKRTTSTVTGDCFPGKSDVTALIAETAPALRDWSGEGVGIGLENIRQTDDKVLFTVVQGPGAAVSEVWAENAEWRLEGNVLTVTGLPAGTVATVHDLTGRLVAAGPANADGTANLALTGTKGIYMLTAGPFRLKLAV